MVHEAYNAPACIWSTLKISLSNVRSSEISTTTLNTTSSVQNASRDKMLNLWYLVYLDLPIFKYLSHRKYSPVEIVCLYPSVSSFSAIPFSSTFKIYTAHLSFQTLTQQTTELLRTQIFLFWSISSTSRSHSSSRQTDPTGGIDLLLVSDNFKQLLKSSSRHC